MNVEMTVLIVAEIHGKGRTLPRMTPEKLETTGGDRDHDQNVASSLTQFSFLHFLLP